MAAAKKPKLDNITQCELCREPYNDPRTLPCTHNFCLQCINQHCNDLQAVGKASCPLCTIEFVIPANGLNDMPKNFFLVKLVQLEMIAGSKKGQWPCELCNSDEEGEEKKEAMVYCIDCQEKYCDTCAGYHKKQKATRDNKLVQLGDNVNLDDIVTTSSIQTCSKHSEEQLKLFCVQCQTAICVVCYTELHNTHKCSSFADTAEEFRKQMATDSDDIADGVDHGLQMLDSFEEDKQAVVNLCKQLEDEICNRAEDIKLAAERHKQKLLSELDIIKLDRQQDIDGECKNLAQRIKSLVRLRRYTESLISNGTATDMARESSTLHDRTVELLNFEGIRTEKDAMGTIDISFAASDVHVGNNSNIIGKISTEFTFKDVELTGTIPSFGFSITGLTAINDDIFVAREIYEKIVIYDSKTFAVKHEVESSYSGYWGLASCKTNDCVYAACRDTSVIVKINLSDYSVSKEWKSALYPMGLSIDAGGNVLVACYGKHRLQKYKTDGTIVLDINLKTLEITKPVHAVQTSTGNYLVSYSTFDYMQGISEVSADGNSVVRHCQKPAGQLSGYFALNSTGKQGNVLICSGGAIRILNTSLANSRDLPLMPVTTAVGALQLPFAIHLNETGGRLYIGEFAGDLGRTGGRVLVVDNVYF